MLAYLICKSYAISLCLENECMVTGPQPQKRNKPDSMKMINVICIERTQNGTKTTTTKIIENKTKAKNKTPNESTEYHFFCLM